MKILLINDTDGRENIGCRLTSRMLKNNLANAFRSLGIQVNIVPAPWRFGRSMGPQLTARFLMGDARFPTITSLRALAKREYGATTVRDLDSYDLCIFQPEGTINSWDNPLRIIRFLSLPLLCSQSSSTPLAILNGTLPTFGDCRSELISFVLQHADYKSARDRITSHSYGIGFLPDAACSWPGMRSVKPLAKRKFLLITTSAKFSKEQNIQFARRAIGIALGHELKPLILTKQWQDLVEIRDEVFSLGGDFRYFEELMDASELLSTCRLHMGGRYHMAILCACVDVPSIMVGSNSEKNRWLANECNGIYLAGSVSNLNALAGKAIQEQREKDIICAMSAIGANHLELIKEMASAIVFKQNIDHSSAAAEPQDLSVLKGCWPGGLRSIHWGIVNSIGEKRG